MATNALTDLDDDLRPGKELYLKFRDFNELAKTRYPNPLTKNYNPEAEAKGFFSKFKTDFGLKYDIDFTFEPTKSKGTLADTTINYSTPTPRHLVHINPNYMRKNPNLQVFLNTLRHEAEHCLQNDDYLRFALPNHDGLSNYRQLAVVVRSMFDVLLAKKFGEYDIKYFKQNVNDILRAAPEEYDAFREEKNFDYFLDRSSSSPKATAQKSPAPILAPTRPIVSRKNGVDSSVKP